MLDFNRFETITFDCYGTLINWEAGILPVLHQILSAHKLNVEDARLLKLYGDCEMRAEEGDYHSYRLVLQSVVRRLGANLGFAPTDEQAESLPDSLPSWKPWSDTVEALRRLKSRFRLAIISNTDDDLFATTRPQLEVAFDEVITAQQARAYKPSRQIFELALQRIQTPAHRVLHVGQSIFHDVVPAQALGLATVWVNRPSARPGIGAVMQADATPDLTVTTLAELADLALSS